MSYTIYNPQTGKITGNVGWYDPTVSAEQAMLEGIYSAADYYIENNIPVAKPSKPDLNNAYDFDYTTKTWQINLKLSTVRIRNQRNQLLTAVDAINPVRYSTLSDQQKSDVVAYRQALLDVPQQDGFPSTILWPTKPEWL